MFHFRMYQTTITFFYQKLNFINFNSNFNSNKINRTSSKALMRVSSRNNLGFDDETSFNCTA